MASENTSPVAESAVVTANKSDSKIVIFAVVAALVVVVGVAAFVLLGRGGGAGISSKAIPSDWEKFDSETFSFGHPKDFDVEESFSEGMLTVSKSGADAGDSIFGATSMSINFSDGSDVELTAENEEMVTFVKAGDCGKLTDFIKESSAGSLDSLGGASINISGSAADINNGKGCFYKADGEVMGFKFSIEGLALISKEDDKKSVAFTVQSYGDNNDISAFKDMMSTVSFK